MANRKFRTWRSSSGTSYRLSKKIRRLSRSVYDQKRQSKTTMLLGVAGLAIGAIQLFKSTK